MSGEGGGCGVVGLGVAGLVVLVLVVLLVNGLSQFSDSETSRMYAEQALVIAQGQADATRAMAAGQSRLDSAQAFAVTAGAGLPWLITGLLGVSGLVLIAAVVAMLVLALRVTQVNRQDRLLLAMAMQGMLPERREYLALQAPERREVIEL